MRNYAALVGAVLLTAACADSPQEVADRFWTAAQQGDEQTIRETSVESWGDRRFRAGDDDRIGDISFGDTEIEGDEAWVETRLTHTDDDVALEISFETVLVRRDGEWLVDLDATTSRLVASLLGTSVREFAGALADGLGEAMEELAEGLADGMRELGEAMSDAFEEGYESGWSGAEPDEPAGARKESSEL